MDAAPNAPIPETARRLVDAATGSRAVKKSVLMTLLWAALCAGCAWIAVHYGILRRVRHAGITDTNELVLFFHIVWFGGMGVFWGWDAIDRVRLARALEDGELFVHPWPLVAGDPVRFRYVRALRRDVMLDTIFAALECKATKARVRLRSDRFAIRDGKLDAEWDAQLPANAPGAPRGVWVLVVDEAWRSTGRETHRFRLR